MPQIRVYGEDVDGYIVGSNAVYATARSTSSASYAAGADIRVGQGHEAGTYRVRRGFLSIPTAGLNLPARARIVRARLCARVQADSSTQDFVGMVYRWDWAETLAANREANYDGAYGGVYEGALFDTGDGRFALGQWYEMDVDPSRVNLSGDTKYTLVSNRDVNADVPADATTEWAAIFSTEGASPYFLLIEWQEPRTYAVSHAPARVLPYIFNRAGALLGDPLSLIQHVKGLRFNASIPGGFREARFWIPQRVRTELFAKSAYRLELRCGMGQAWAGRIADIARSTSSGGMAELTAFGAWESLQQRRATVTAAPGETGDEVVERVLPLSPLVSTNWQNVWTPGFDLDGGEWEDETLQAILEAVGKAGDSQSPPRRFYLNLWHTVAMFLNGGQTVQVSAGPDDAHDRSDGADSSHNAAVVRIGASGVNYYHAGWIFRNLTIPRYARILSAVITFNSAGDLGADEPVTGSFYAERSVNPATFAVSWPSARVKSHAAVAWSRVWPAAGLVNSPDLSQLLQELVNMPAWRSGCDADIIFRSNPNAGFDTRKQIEAWDDPGVLQASLTVTWGPSEGQVMAFISEFIPRRTATQEYVDYLVSMSDLEGDFGLTQSTEELANSVVVTHSAGATAAAEDMSSIERYDRREARIAAGSGVSAAQAQNIRDMHLARHSELAWKASGIKVRRLRDRHGHSVNLAMVRPGSVLQLQDFPTFTPVEGRCFFIVSTEYDADSGVLTLNPDLPPDSLEIILTRLGA